MDGNLRLRGFCVSNIGLQDFEIDGILSGEIFGFDGILSATEFLRVTEY